jgi:hypothetical protein
LPYRSRDVGFTDFDERSSGASLARTPNLQKLFRMSQGIPRNPKEREVMSPQAVGISTTYKTRVALEKPCKWR